MRKFLLTAAVLLISVTAYADPSFRVAENDQPPAQPAETAAEPAKPTEPTQAAEPAKASDSAKATESAKAVEPAKGVEPAPAAETKPVQIQKPKQRAASRESDEHKARRIAAKYGVYW
jgi:hypothetical protein